MDGFVTDLHVYKWMSDSDPGTGTFHQTPNSSLTSSMKAGSCLALVGGLQYRTMINCMYWFPLPFQLPVVI